MKQNCMYNSKKIITRQHIFKTKYTNDSQQNKNCIYNILARQKDH